MTDIHTYFSISDGRDDIKFLGNNDGTITISLAFLDTIMLAQNYAREGDV